ncbi:MAG: hypothetical protein ACRDRX_14000 [Pseudonocardiaceae bacterium]
MIRLFVDGPSATESGTPLIQTNQTMGIDLGGTTRIGYPDIARLAQRHGIPADDHGQQRGSGLRLSRRGRTR